MVHGFLDLLPYTNSKDTTEEFIDNIASKLKDHLVKSNNRDEKIIDFVDPDDLAKRFDFTLNEDGVPLKDIGDITDQILKYVVKTGMLIHLDFFLGKKSKKAIKSVSTLNSLYIHVFTRKFIIDNLAVIRQFF